MSVPYYLLYSMAGIVGSSLDNTVAVQGCQVSWENIFLGIEKESLETG
jgi:hypothetical protein